MIQIRHRQEQKLASNTYCFGYVGGYIDGLNVLTEQVCVRGASLETIARVYVIYMQKNPKLMDEGRALGLLLSPKDSYGCTKPPTAKAAVQQGNAQITMFPDRTPEELTAYVKRLEKLAWRLVGDSEEYQTQ